jgi:hypothetical protein
MRRRSIRRDDRSLAHQAPEQQIAHRSGEQQCEQQREQQREPAGLASEDEGLYRLTVLKRGCRRAPADPSGSPGNSGDLSPRGNWYQPTAIMIE